jgi:transposase
MTVTVLSGPERRRRWTTAEKVRIVNESLAPGVMVSEVARQHDIHPHQLHRWRQLARRGLLAPAPDASTTSASGSCFVPVAVMPDSKRSARREDVGEAALLVELVLRNGRVLRLPQSVAPARAAALADALEGLAR